MPELADLSLMDLIPRLSPEHRRPWHLAGWIALIERAASEPVRGLCAVPIRHFKSETTLHGIIWLLLKDPTLPVILLTHSFERAQSLGKRLRALARETPIGPTRGYDQIADWRNDRGGGCVIMSAEQSRLGYDCGALFFDDPVDEHGAEEPRVREEVDSCIAHYGARTVRNGKPGPILGVASRWHPDDPIGRRLTRRAVHWEYIHAPAIVDEGLETERAFAEDVWPLEALKKMRAEWAEKDPTERGWWAQLMGEPRVIGSDLFGPATRYSVLPTWGYRTVYGADFAFTDGENSDFFVLAVLRLYGRKAYLMEVQRHKIDAVTIESTCKAALMKFGHAPIFTYQSGPEIGMSKVLIERGVPIVPMHARYSKLVRAQRTIKRWNDGDILVPEDAAAPWVPGFLQRMQGFRGHDKDDGDDEPDAIVSACDGGLGGPVGAPRFIPRQARA